MHRVALLALGSLTLTACGLQNAFDLEGLEGEMFEDDDLPIEGFARGQHFEDVGTMTSPIEGFALGSDRFAAVGMVGMVCSFSVDRGEILVDVDPDSGDELVVDARAEVDGFSTLSVDGGQMTISVFPEEWSGEVSVDVTTPGGDIDDADMTYDGVVALRHDEGLCIIERYATGSSDAIAATPLPGACISGVDTDFDGVAYASTDSTTYAIGLDGVALDHSGPSNHIAFGDESGTLALAHGNTVRTDLWSSEVGSVTSLAWVGGNRLVATVDGADSPELVLIDGDDGLVIERIATTGLGLQISASPEGGVIAVESVIGLHMVRVQ